MDKIWRKLTRCLLKYARISGFVGMMATGLGLSAPSGAFAQPVTAAGKCSMEVCWEKRLNPPPPRSITPTPTSSPGDYRHCQGSEVVPSKLGPRHKDSDYREPKATKSYPDCITLCMQFITEWLAKPRNEGEQTSFSCKFSSGGREVDLTQELTEDLDAPFRRGTPTAGPTTP